MKNWLQDLVLRSQLFPIYSNCNGNDQKGRNLGDKLLRFLSRVAKSADQDADQFDREIKERERESKTKSFFF